MQKKKKKMAEACIRKDLFYSVFIGGRT